MNEKYNEALQVIRDAAKERDAASKQVETLQQDNARLRAALVMAGTHLRAYEATDSLPESFRLVCTARDGIDAALEDAR